jgi:hypothetical protein
MSGVVVVAFASACNLATVRRSSHMGSSHGKRVVIGSKLVGLALLPIGAMAPRSTTRLMWDRSVRCVRG